MSRNNPIGQGGQPPWRHPADQDPFTAPAPAAPQQGYGYQQAGQGYYFPPAPEQAPAQQPQFGHFAPAQPVPYPPPQEWSQQPDPRGYDLGNYMPADTPSYAPAQQPQYTGAQQGYGEPDPEFDEMVEDDDEPRRGRRALMIVAALVGAIGLGGGLAYTYKTFVVAKGGSRPPLVKAADTGPPRVKPVVPGGKEFAHTDRKLPNRLSEDGQEPAADDAPRRVKVIPITPGDQASASQASAPPAVPVTVPGVTLDNMGPPPVATRSALPPPVVPQPTAQQPPPMKIAPPPVKVVAPAPAAEEAPLPPRQTAQVAPPKVAVPKSPPPAAAPVAAPQTTGSSGYVAVLTSQRSRMDALKAFADLQQKYGDALASRTPDVQEADLSARGLGTMYRLVVGPPGSRDAASGVCNQLKTAGYKDCWVTAY